MTKTLQVIGKNVRISFIDNGIYDLSAKVDTGADGSAVWASQIQEQDGQLSFCLLAPSSPKYTGQLISTTSYQRVRVNNSFGKSQVRYRVILKVEVEGHLVKAKFNLANRQLKSYPALIGRRLLNKRFLVDVSKKPV